MHLSRFFIVFTFIACFGSLVVAAQQTPAASNSSTSLAISMNYLQSSLGQIGKVAFSEVTQLNGKVIPFDWTYEIGDVIVAPDLCQISYHGTSATQGNIGHLNKDFAMSLRDVQSIEVESWGKYQTQFNIDWGSHTWLSVSTNPPITVVVLQHLGAKDREMYFDGRLSLFPFTNAVTANGVAKALTNAAIICAAQPTNSQSDDADSKRQDIADKIENLQSDAEEHDSAASDWDTTAQNAQGTSSCNGSALALSICRSMGEAGAAKAQANADKERAAASNDRSDIARLQGQLDSMPANDSSPAGQNTSGNSGGSGSGPGYNQNRHYSGPDADMVQSLLNSSPGWSCPSSISQSIKWTPPIQQVCMRDYYVTAAVAAAYGAECEARLGRDEEAEKDAESMASSVKSAKSMCSNAPVIANNRPGCSTLEIVPCP